MFTVLTKPNCIYCDQAKSLLTSKNLPFQEVYLDVGQEKQKSVSYITREELLAKIPSARTMPQIIKTTDNSSVVIGGYVELKKYLHVA